MEQSIHAAKERTPWNKGKPVGQKAPLKLKDMDPSSRSSLGVQGESNETAPWCRG
jgi:hypothetical protein